MTSGDSRRWWALASLSLSVLVVALDLFVLTLALPTVSSDLHASSSDLQWFVAAYSLVLAAALLPAGLIGDRIGRKRLLTWALALFGVASLACAYSTSAGELIAARAVLGLAAAVILPMSLAVLPVLFSPEERPRAIAAVGGATFLGYPIGPILGGWLLDHYWWGSVFLINIPVVVIALVAVTMLMPESRGDGRPRIDLTGIVVSSAGLTSLTYGLIKAGNNGWTDPTAIATMIAGAALLVGFALWERRVSRRFAGAVTSAAASSSAVGSSAVGSSAVGSSAVGSSAVGSSAVGSSAGSASAGGASAASASAASASAASSSAGARSSARARAGSRAAVQPLVDLGLFGSAGFTWGTILSTLVSFALFGLVFAMPQYFLDVRGLDSLAAGVRMLPMIGGLAVGLIVGQRLQTPRKPTGTASAAAAVPTPLAAPTTATAPAAATATAPAAATATAPAAATATAPAAATAPPAGPVSPKVLVAVGFAIMAVALAVGARTSAASGSGFAAAWFAVTGLGLGVAMPTALNAALGALSPARSGSGSALITAMRQVGGTIGVAVLGTVLATVYRAHLHLPALPAAAGHLIRASVAGGVAVAHSAGSPLLLALVRSAYVHGLDVMLWVCAAIAIVSALLAAAFLPGRTTTVPAEPAAAGAADATLLSDPAGTATSPGARSRMST